MGYCTISTRHPVKGKMTRGAHALLYLVYIFQSDHGDETAQTDTDNPTDDVDEEDDSDEVVVGVPTLDQLAEAEVSL